MGLKDCHCRDLTIANIFRNILNVNASWSLLYSCFKRKCDLQRKRLGTLLLKLTYICIRTRKKHYDQTLTQKVQIFLLFIFRGNPIPSCVVGWLGEWGRIKRANLINERFVLHKKEFVLFFVVRFCNRLTTLLTSAQRGYSSGCKPLIGKYTGSFLYLEGI